MLLSKKKSQNQSKASLASSSILNRPSKNIWVKLALSTALLISVPVILTACKNSSADNTQPDVDVNHSKYLTDSLPRLGIIAAFGQEADLLLEQTQNKKDYRINGRKFTTGLLAGTPIVITISGISMTNAAMTTQMLSDHFQLKGLVFSGIAGSLNPSLHVGDVVVAKSWIAPDEVYYANTPTLPSACGDEGDISCLGLKLDTDIPPFQQRFLRQTNVINQQNYDQVALTTKINNADVPIAYGEMKTDFSVNSEMLNFAQSTKNNTQNQLEAICQTNNQCYSPKIVLGERGVSGGAFLANSQFRDYLHQNLDGDVVDMETTAVAQVAYSNDIPFIAFRSVSDLAGADHDPNVAAFFGSGVAQRNAAKVTIAFVQEWQKTNQLAIK